MDVMRVGDAKQRKHGRSRTPIASLGPVLVCAVVVLMCTGCGHRARAGTSGQKHNVCRAVDFLNNLTQPSPDDIGAVVRYADDYTGILRQTSFKERWTDKKNKQHLPSDAITADFETEMRSMAHYRDLVREAATRAKKDGVGPTLNAIRQAEATLTADTAYSDADKRLYTFATEECRN